MTPHELFKARIIWFYLLDLDDASLLDWRAWAEETLRGIDFIAPFWLCELTVAPTAQTALACVRDGIGLDYTDFPASEIDEQSLLFGLLYSKFARDDEWAKPAWRAMADFGNVFEYVDSGHWRRYQRDTQVNISKLSFENSTSIIFRPIAAYALRTVRKIFKNSMHVKTFMSHLTRPM